MDKHPDHRLAWLAGIIDGEGWIGFHAVGNSHQAGSPKYVNAQWNIGISNTNAAMLTEIMAIGDLLGVKYAWYPIKPRHSSRHKPIGRVVFVGRTACEKVLRAVFDHLVAKRPHAELMLRAIAHRGGPGYRWRRAGYVRIPEDVVFKQMASEIRALNRRGPEPPQGG